jgi:hypothetical protein
MPPICGIFLGIGAGEITQVCVIWLATKVRVLRPCFDRIGAG